MENGLFQKVDICYRFFAEKRALGAKLRVSYIQLAGVGLGEGLNLVCGETLLNVTYKLVKVC